MLFSIAQMVQYDTHAGCSDIKTNLVTMNIPQFNHEIPRSNLHIVEWMNEISISGGTYS